MSLPYGLQSVLFYVLSCSTCTKIAHRQKAKKKAREEREQKHALETEQPGLYRHPSPFSTNPYWEEEITLGPGPPKKKGGGSKNASTRALDTAVLASSATSDGGMSTDAGSSPTMVHEDQLSAGESWNHKRYQREDEELWGHEIQRAGQKVREALATAGSQVGSTLRALEERLSKSGPSKEEESTSPYYVVKNPPVNDLHPPVVASQPTHKNAMRWMLQPPPPAKVMEGKETPNRSRSGSRGSSRKDGREIDTLSLSLSRQVTGRAVEERLRRGETPEMLPLSRPHSQAKSPELRPLTRLSSHARSPELRPLTRPSSRNKIHGSTTPRSNRRFRAGTGSHSLESSDEDAPRQFKPSPLFSAVAGRRLSEDSIEEVPIPSFELSSIKAPKSELPRENPPPRPPLSTIASSSNSPPPKLNSPDFEKQLLQSSENVLMKKVTADSEGKASMMAMPSTLPMAEGLTTFPGPDNYTFPPKTAKTEEEIGEISEQQGIQARESR